MRGLEERRDKRDCEGQKAHRNESFEGGTEYGERLRAGEAWSCLRANLEHTQWSGMI